MQDVHRLPFILRRSNAAWLCTPKGEVLTMLQVSGQTSQVSLSQMRVIAL